MPLGPPRAARAAALLFLLLAAGCPGAEREPPDDDGGVIDRPVADAYAIAGHSPLEADLYALDLVDAGLQRLTRGARVSWLAGSCEGWPVLAAAASLGDELATYRDGELVPVPAARGQHTITPSVDRACRAAYVDPAGGSIASFRVKTLELSGGHPQVLFRTRTEIAVTTWDAQGRVAVLERPGIRARILVLGAGGEVATRIDPRLPRAEALLWSARGLVAVADRAGGGSTKVLRGREEIATIDGWVALAWSPSGQRLLVARDRTLGVVRAPRFGPVEELGTARLPVWGAIWARSGPA